MIAKRVLEFYQTLPFNSADSPEVLAREISESNSIEAYGPLAALLKPNLRVLEIGCGVGRIANRMAYHYGAKVTAIDFNPEAIRQAKAAAAILGLSVEFQVADLFAYSAEQPYDLVVSLGVLHHTHDCHEAVRHLSRNCLSSGGYAFIGLYHSYGRQPFLAHFQMLKEAGRSEGELLREYKKLHRALKDDETMLLSWFRDQVCHPHETQHTQREMTALLQEEGLELVSSSINGFKPFDRPTDLDALEPGYTALAQKRLAKGEYFPGFFVFLARKA
ncbi:MAG: class I SAM-dependent methyltransferase [Proteobacteria bacterium]|nr:class I SAM-dependent methyltransferase [Pseudomonadota bacterium]MBU1594050.1 class I SAM-dependent methyltransferase [Pseudomonadota bacterium]